VVRFGLEDHASLALLLRRPAAVVLTPARATHALFDAHPMENGWARRGAVGCLPASGAEVTSQREMMMMTAATDVEEKTTPVSCHV
jgi:hypothetical protein